MWLADFEVYKRGPNIAFRAANALRARKNCGHAGSKSANGCILNRTWKLKMEIPVDITPGYPGNTREPFDKMGPVTVFLLGCAGALAPEIVRLYSIRSNPSQFKWSGFYVIVSILFALLGGLVAVALPAMNSWSAIYAGVSTPVVVNTMLKKRMTGRSKRAYPPGAARADLRTFVSGL
jgi:hypothetical protein